MTKNDFIYYLSHPENLDATSIGALEKLVNEYPYFQAGRMLYLKNLHNENSIDYEKNLHITSAYAPSGKVLYNLIKKSKGEQQVMGEQQVNSRSTASEQPETVFPKEEPVYILKEVTIEKGNDEFDELEILEKEMLREAYRTSMTVDLLREDEGKSQISKAAVQPQTLNLKRETNSYSFNDWLKVVNGQTPESAIEEKEVQKRHSNQLIDDFLLDQTARSEPKPKAEFYSAETMAKKSIQDDETFVSETLASIYLKQGNLPKALRAYEILIVKYPEKLHIFAPLLEKIKKLLKDQKNK